MNTNFMHYKIELAFDHMEEAILKVQEHAEPGDKLFYGRLMDELIGIRDHYRQELIDLHTKKAAPAAATTETAKNDSDKESTFSLDEKQGDVKRSALILTVVDAERVDSEVSIHGPNKDLLRLYSAAVESVYFAAPKVGVGPLELLLAHKHGMNEGLERLENESKEMFGKLGKSAQDDLVRLAKKLNLSDGFLQKFTGGAEE